MNLLPIIRRMRRPGAVEEPPLVVTRMRCDACRREIAAEAAASAATVFKTKETKVHTFQQNLPTTTEE